MGFLDTLTGKTGKRVAGETLAYNQGQANEGYAANKGYAQQGYGAATGRLNPYAEAGGNAFTQYQNMLGLNGGQAQQGAMGQYQQFNPYRAASTQRLMQAGDRRAAATGQFGSGLNALARARVADDGEMRDYENYMGRLQQMGGMGMGAAGQMAGYDMNNAQNMIGIEGQYRNALTGARNNYAQQYTQADTAGVQNIIGLGTAAAQLAMGMPPTSLGSMGKGQQVYSQPGNAMNGGWSTTANMAPQGNNFSNFLSGLGF